MAERTSSSVAVNAPPDRVAADLARRSSEASEASEASGGRRAGRTAVADPAHEEPAAGARAPGRDPERGR